MDYVALYLYSSDNKVHGIFSDLQFPVFHNWEYDLKVPSNRSTPVWTARANPTPVVCGGAPPVTNNAPGDPENVSISWGNGTVTVSWDQPTNTGSSGITDYEYRYSSQQNAQGIWENWIDWVSAGSDDTEVYITELTNGILYAFQVRTESGTAYSSGTDVATEKPSTKPDAPTNLIATCYNGWVNLSWTPHITRITYCVCWL